ncbi:50S ribosomal protein L3 N(5)-glutamine methyltransferase [Candidatus Ishikawella capsulata]|uniref:N5-glutamine methyltransferase n=1 Tax=Candidatus Ishikawaella capsulata Mpkobe TaxID=476281 RepID=C5WCB1_9ENTR|nr:50S ribosomal protein L3 N(5)-glutamine methyltransferase [Candidatus Ishikawaella capsulata]BAH82967.1 N5-glutamine methyltransferase [Candidatus Ishikawaella capsulata Mpkobe]
MKNPLLSEIQKDLHTIQDMLRWTVSYFSSNNIYYGHGTDNPWDEALQLILPTIYLPIDIPIEIRKANLTVSERQQIVKLAVRRVIERIPVAYITNKSWFCGYEFYVDERVLIPRSPIAELIENRFLGLISYNPQNILDMCTGSGCIAISCANFFPEATIDAVDISQDALNVARQNVIAHSLLHRIKLIRSNLFQELPLTNKYDLVIANPPYVDVEELKHLPKEYSYEPAIGFIAGSQGLEVVIQIINSVSAYLSENGILVCEVGNNMMNLIKRYPQLPFNWLALNNGGEGIFMLNRKQIANFIKYL